MITKALASFLLATPEITGIAKEIRPQKLMEGHGDPALVYTLVDSRRDRTLDGYSSIAQATFQIDSFSANYEQVKRLAGAVRDSLEDYDGLFGDYRAEQIDFISESDEFEPETKLNHITQVFGIWYTGL
jgi:hypothetical protein